MNTKQIIRYLLEDTSRYPTPLEVHDYLNNEYIRTTPENAHASCYILSDGSMIQLPFHHEHAIRKIFKDLRPDYYLVSTSQDFINSTGLVRYFDSSGEISLDIPMRSKVTVEQLGTIKKIFEIEDDCTWNIGNVEDGKDYESLLDTLDIYDLLESIVEDRERWPTPEDIERYPTPLEVHDYLKKEYPLTTSEKAHGSCFILTDGSIIQLIEEHTYSIKKLFDDLRPNDDFYDLAFSNPQKFINEYNLIRFIEYRNETGLKFPKETKITVEQLTAVKKIFDVSSSVKWAFGFLVNGNDFESLLDALDDYDLLESTTMTISDYLIDAGAVAGFPITTYGVRAYYVLPDGKRYEVTTHYATAAKYYDVDSDSADMTNTVVDNFIEEGSLVRVSIHGDTFAFQWFGKMTFEQVDIIQKDASIFNYIMWHDINGDDGIGLDNFESYIEQDGLVESAENRKPETPEHWQELMYKHLELVTPEKADYSSFILSDGTIAQVPYCEEHYNGIEIILNALYVFDDARATLPEYSDLFGQTDTIRLLVMDGEVNVSIYINHVTQSQLRTIKQVVDANDNFYWNIGNNTDSGNTLEGLIYALEDDHRIW